MQSFCWEENSNNNTKKKKAEYPASMASITSNRMGVRLGLEY